MQYSYRLGLSKEYSFIDIWSLEGEDLEFIPKPVVAVVFLFPVKDNMSPDKSHHESDGDVIFIKQTIPNACGTIALLHALSNNTHILKENAGFIFDLIKTKESDRSVFLENSNAIKEIHKDFAVQGQTVGEASDTDLHFICFVEKNGKMYELDGRNSGPKQVGIIQQTLLHDACLAIKEIMNKDPEEMNFTTLALAKGD